MKNWLGLSVGLAAVLTAVVIAPPALAQTTSDGPGDDTANMLATLAVLLVLAIVAYFGVLKLASLYESSKNTELNQRSLKSGAVIFALGLALVVWRVTEPSSSSAKAPSPGPATVDNPQHAGVVQAVGSYHVEAALHPDGSMSVYLTGPSTEQPYPIANHTISAAADGPNGAHADITMTAVEQFNDANGTASAFSAMLPNKLKHGPVLLTVTVPLNGVPQSVRIAVSKPTLPTGAIPPP